MTMPASPTSNATAEGRLPAAPLRGRVLVATALAALGVIGAALLVQRSLGTSWTHPLFSGAVFLLLMATAILAIRNHHPFPAFGLANQVTMVRAGLVSLSAGMIVEPPGVEAAWALAAGTAAFSALDGVDGWIARRSRMNSAFGARFDMETDAFCILVLAILVWRHGKAGPWVLGIGLMRYAFVAAGWIWPWLAGPLRSSLRGKTVAVAQVLALGLALLPVVPRDMSRPACAAALAALAWSFAVDVRFLWRLRHGAAR